MEDKDFLIQLREDFNLSQQKLANRLGCSKSYIGQIESGNSPLSDKFREKIMDLFYSKKDSSSEITYYMVNGSCGPGVLILEEPDVKTIWLDNDLIYKILRTKPENLHIIRAEGDSMVDADIYEGDILLVDKSRIDPMISGIYVFTTQNNELVYIKRLQLRPDNVLEVISENKSYKTLEYTNQDIEKLDLRIKGRIIKNLSRGL